MTHSTSATTKTAATAMTNHETTTMKKPQRTMRRTTKTADAASGGATQTMMMKLRKMTTMMILTMMMMTKSAVVVFVGALPMSKPYIAYRTDPRQSVLERTTNDAVNEEGIDDTMIRGGVLDHDILHPNAMETDHVSMKKSRITFYQDEALVRLSCPVQFSLGMTQHGHGNAGTLIPNTRRIQNAPVLHTLYPMTAQQGKQVIYTTQFEHMHVLSPALLTTPGQAIKEVLVGGGPEFPLLMESSSFHSSPIVHDVNGDGNADVILSDYDGGITILGLGGGGGGATKSDDPQHEQKKRYFHHVQLPRLYIRRGWVSDRIEEARKEAGLVVDDREEEKKNEQQGQDGIGSDENNNKNNRKNTISDPYHSYFEYLYVPGNGQDRRIAHEGGEVVLKGVSANALHQDIESMDALKERRKRNVNLSNKNDNAATKNQTQHEQNEEMSGSGTTTTYQNDTVTIANEMDTAGNLHEIPKQQQQQQQQDEEESRRRRLQEVDGDQGGGGDGENQQGEQMEEEKKRMIENNEQLQPDDVVPEEGDDANKRMMNDDVLPEEGDDDNDDEVGNVDGSTVTYDDLQVPREDDEYLQEKWSPGEGEDEGDDVSRLYNGEGGGGGDDDNIYPRDYVDDYYYGRGQDDDTERSRHYEMDDDVYGYNGEHGKYYDEKNYVRIPPHILCTPVHVELPKTYGNKEIEDVLLIAVSYYLDEDEEEGFSPYQRFSNKDPGGETEVQRGMYVASAILAYIMEPNGARWMQQKHLDLSTDFTSPENATIVDVLPTRADVTKMSAFALASPTVADIDGDGGLEVLVGTSMGILYAFDIRYFQNRPGFPVQMKYPIEHRVLVEDVRDDTNLEMFVSDIGGNVFCLNHKGKVLWKRDIMFSLKEQLITVLDEYGNEHVPEVTGTSPMTLGDIDGDGLMDLVLAIRISMRNFIIAFVASTGDDVRHFPIEVDAQSPDEKPENELHQKLTQPLLVNLKGNAHIEDYIRRNSTMEAVTKTSGLHIVQPMGENLYMIDGETTCTQTLNMGDPVIAMIQADDVHGTSRLDLVVGTESGKVITLESTAPYHPLNTWTNGDGLRGRTNAHAHGYSATQGIYVHEKSRQYRDVFGVYVPIQFEIFDNRPNIENEPEKRRYMVEIRDGTSSKRVLSRVLYNETGIYHERVYIQYGPGYYSLSVLLFTSHGLVYEDSFNIGYNVHFMDGFGALLILPLLLSSTTIFICGAAASKEKPSWQFDDDDSTPNTPSNKNKNERSAYSWYQEVTDSNEGTGASLLPT